MHRWPLSSSMTAVLAVHPLFALENPVILLSPTPGSRPPPTPGCVSSLCPVQWRSILPVLVSSANLSPRFPATHMPILIAVGPGAVYCSLLISPRPTVIPTTSPWLLFDEFLSIHTSLRHRQPHLNLNSIYASFSPFYSPYSLYIYDFPLLSISPQDP